MSCGSCSEKTKAGAASAIGSPQATGGVVGLTGASPIPQEEMEYLVGGAGDEGDISRVIKKYLLTSEQKQGLSEMGVSLEDVLNGRYPANSEFVRNMLSGWNSRLGQKVFFILE